MPVTALSEVGRPVSTVSYVEQPLDASRKALVLETVPGHIVNAQVRTGSVPGGGRGMVWGRSWVIQNGAECTFATRRSFSEVRRLRRRLQTGV